jgi:hypothetical protein
MRTHQTGAAMLAAQQPVLSFSPQMSIWPMPQIDKRIVNACNGQTDRWIQTHRIAR